MENTAPFDEGGGTMPSLRLLQILRTYCRGLDPAGLGDLRRSVSTGHYPWLRAELAAALCAPDPSGPWWQESIGDTSEVMPAADPRSAQQRLWRVLFPTDPYPQPSGTG